MDGGLRSTAKAAASLMNYIVTQKNIYTNRPVGETLDEMRQRLLQKRNDQELIEQNQESMAEARRSKLVMRSEDGGGQRYPEKVILLAKGVLTKEKAYQASFKYGPVDSTEIEEDESMGASPKREDNCIPSLPPAVPPHVPTSPSCSSITALVSNSIIGLRPQLPIVLSSQQRKQSQRKDSNVIVRITTMQKAVTQTTLQKQNKNRIELIDKTILPFTSPRREIPTLQQDAYLDS
ncbi:unnamed protein product [Didymodactylos carnosus]|uniref:Uncharacterized protein n=1 Tax=Didymodactylos carnosus TaxID=1234261 RepID=A0A8S2S7V6_9BILA|nr:unnamed protein product [Didymodactylos carnosus]